MSLRKRFGPVLVDPEIGRQTSTQLLPKSAIGTDGGGQVIAGDR